MVLCLRGSNRTSQARRGRASGDVDHSPGSGAWLPASVTCLCSPVGYFLRANCLILSAVCLLPRAVGLFLLAVGLFPCAVGLFLRAVGLFPGAVGQFPRASCLFPTAICLFLRAICLFPSAPRALLVRGGARLPARCPLIGREDSARISTNGNAGSRAVGNAGASSGSRTWRRRNVTVVLRPHFGCEVDDCEQHSECNDCKREQEKQLRGTGRR
jgi:hypothetical protein